MGRVSGIHDATAVDAAAICRIYNQAIEDRIATLETEERTPEDRRAWLAARGLRHPVLVAEADGVVVGWASLNVFNARRAYDHVADLSLYVERAARGKGLGGGSSGLSSRGPVSSATTSWCCRRSPGTRPGCAPTAGRASETSVSTGSRAGSTDAGSTRSSWRSA